MPKELVNNAPDPRCFVCPKPDCNNCLSEHNASVRASRKRKQDKENPNRRRRRSRYDT